MTTYVLETQPPALHFVEELPVLDYFAQDSNETDGFAPADTLVFTDPELDRLSAREKRKIAHVGAFCVGLGLAGVTLGLGGAYAVGQLAGDTIESVAQPTRYESPENTTPQVEERYIQEASTGSTGTAAGTQSLTESITSWGQSAGEWTTEHAAEPLGWMTLTLGAPTLALFGAGALSGQATERRRRREAAAALDLSEAATPTDFEVVSPEGYHEQSQKRPRRYKGDHRRYLSMDNIDEVVLHKPYEPRPIHGLFLKLDERVDDNWPQWRDAAIDKATTASHATAVGVAGASKAVAETGYAVAAWGVTATARTARAVWHAARDRYMQMREARAEQQRLAKEVLHAMPADTFQDKALAGPNYAPLPGLLDS